ncbi:MAG: ribbon-helix-helix protein, CopG family [Thermoplasmatales archaeon]|nr:ribbon-helix-helix protein, CopG family [Thermoplasmatales archaeon]
MDTTIRHIDENVYRKLKAKAALEGLSIGEAITEAIKAWLSYRKKEKKASILDIKPVRSKRKNKMLSVEVDSILYGERT